MSFRTWLYIATFGIIIATTVQAQEQGQGAEKNAATHRGPSEPDPFGLPIRIIEDGISADAREQSERE